MKRLLIVAVLLYLVVSVTSSEEKWQQFKLEHRKSYRSLFEEKRRYAIFQQNLIDIENHNTKFAKGEKTYTKGITRFTDLTKEEFLAMFKGQAPPARWFTVNRDNISVSSVINVTANEEIDYVKKGLVTGVKDMGECEAAFEFAVCGAIEGQIAKKTGNLTSLSAQQLTDCAATDSCMGLYGTYVLDWIKQSGISREVDYPYTGLEEMCKKGQGDVKVSDFKFTKMTDAADLYKAHVSIGPLSVNIDPVNLQNYKSGILDGEGCTEYMVLASLLLVGSGSDNGIAYYRLKNSWGTKWGEEGYVRIQRTDDNICGIASYAFYPVL